MAISFGILGYYGREIYREAPTIPEKVVLNKGEELADLREAYALPTNSKKVC